MTTQPRGGDDTPSLFPQSLTLSFEKVRGDLRYGENPFQRAALYKEPGFMGPSIATGELLSGKDLSHNNILDLDAALRIVREFREPCSVVIKHRNPCGAAIAPSATQAWLRAHDGDRVSAFGSVLGFNVMLDPETAELIAVDENFIECIVAPGFDPDALRILTGSTKWGKSLRCVAVGDVHWPLSSQSWDMRRILGGLLVQEYDLADVPEGGVQCVSVRPPTIPEMSDLRFAWLIAKHVTSNAIVLARDGMVVGVGAGQMSRVDSSWMAARKAGDRAKGSAVASDAFFPFADALEVALAAGATAVIQPGGSKRDEEVIAAANSRGAAMVFTHTRHFKH